MKLILFFAFLLTIFATNIQAKPRITVINDRTINNFAKIKIINETTEQLACYIAIDGQKLKFRLPPRANSRWIKATDERYNFTHFSTWCDYINLHPQYKNYPVG